MLKRFDDIERECLEPLKRVLVDLCARFGYVKGHLPTYEVLDIVSRAKTSVDMRYWVNYSFRNICNAPISGRRGCWVRDGSLRIVSKFGFHSRDLSYEM
ncbi:MAG: hypothetical protein QXE77_03880 [Desulfurococcaceae archaeon]